MNTNELMGNWINRRSKLLDIETELREIGFEDTALLVKMTREELNRCISDVISEKGEQP